MDETQFVPFSFEQLARLTKKDATEIKDELTKLDPDTGNPLSQDEKFEAISGMMGQHFKQVIHDARIRGGKEILKSKTRQLAEKYGLQGGELEELFEQAKGIAANEVKEGFTAEHAFKHEEVKTKIDALQRALAEKEKEITLVKEGYQKEKVLSRVHQQALSVLEAKGAQFSSDPIRKQRQLNALKSILNEHAYQVKEDGSVAILNENGMPLEDANYNVVKFDDFVVSNSVVDFRDVVQPKSTIAPAEKSGEVSGLDGFTPEQLENYSSEYMRLRGEGKHDAAKRLLEAGQKFRNQKK